MHPRNKNADGYDLAALTATSAALARFHKTTPDGKATIDFANPAAVKALNRIQVQLSALYPEKGGYVLVDFSEPLDDALQAVLVYRCDLQRVLELAVEVGIFPQPSLQRATQSA